MIPVPSSTTIISNIVPDAQNWTEFMLPFVYIAVGLLLMVAVYQLFFRLFEGGFYRMIHRSHDDLDVAGERSAHLLGVARRRDKINQQLDDAWRLHTRDW